MRVPRGEECECEMKFNNSLCPLNYTHRIKCGIRDHKKIVLLKRIEFHLSLSTFFTVSGFKN